MMLPARILFTLTVVHNKLINDDPKSRLRLYLSHNITEYKFPHNTTTNNFLTNNFSLIELNCILYNINNRLQMPLIFFFPTHNVNQYQKKLIHRRQLQIKKIKRRMNQTITKSSPLLLNKSILARNSILKRLDACQKDMTQQRTKVSHLYQQLQRKIQFGKNKHQEEMEQIQKGIQFMEQEMKEEKVGIHEVKVELWELKNEILYLEELAQNECNQEQMELDYDGEEEEQLSGSEPSEEIQPESQPNIQTLKDMLSRWGQDREVKL